ncbi:uncharacterized protein LOC132743075 [Ruditapes philippinarum]|uniref:uncharacterized protein LOC132743075 n=1 Tax=Ruditapes philippinarum TaxID=129788 RepID=UPI00295A7286|nr:uncharacterized protein LOC132743075 [Ruditapes philippinarum]
MAEGGSIEELQEKVSFRIGGGFRRRKIDVDDITVSDFYNPWNFYHLFMQEDSFVVKWCIRNGLLPNEIPCISKVSNQESSSKCHGIMKFCKMSGRSTGFTLRCNRNRNHECASRKYSFFEKSKLTIQDIMVFIKTYLEANTLYQCSRQSGIHYQSTGVDWGSFIRELFKEHFHTHVLTRKLKGVIEIDESLFGRRIKHHRGNPRKGCKIWVFGMVERESNSIILYPVRERSQKTLLPLIERHVEKGSTMERLLPFK